MVLPELSGELVKHSYEYIASGAFLKKSLEIMTNKIIITVNEIPCNVSTSML